MNTQISGNVIITDGKVMIRGIELPPVPSNKNYHQSAIINDKVYINGYEWKRGKWRRTLKALYYLMF